MSFEFGPILKSLRGELGMSQADIANRLGTTQRHVSFLETGRSQPGRSMLGRLVTDLDLNAAQRAALFDGSGYRNPYKRRKFGSDEVTETLDMIENRMLAHWPFPAFVLDANWTVLRMNTPAKNMFEPFAESSTDPINLFTLFLSDAFLAMVDNWDEARSSIYFRLQSAAASSKVIKEKFDAARARGLFENIAQTITSADNIPIFVPIVLKRPDGSRLKITSMLGQLVSVHDALVEGFEIELMVPVDVETEACLLENVPRK